jgi:hypothetical protein
MDQIRRYYPGVQALVLGDSADGAGRALVYLVAAAKGLGFLMCELLKLSRIAWLSPRRRLFAPGFIGG